MSLSAIRSQLSGVEKRLDSIQGKGKEVEYVWSSVAGGVKTILAGDPGSRARSIIEIRVVDADGPGSSPRIIIDGTECNYGQNF